MLYHIIINDIYYFLRQKEFLKVEMDRLNTSKEYQEWYLWIIKEKTILSKITNMEEFSINKVKLIIKGNEFFGKVIEIQLIL